MNEFKGKDKSFIDNWVQAQMPDLDLSAYEKFGYLKGYSGFNEELEGSFKEKYDRLMEILITA
jgi:hypothetical protein